MKFSRLAVSAALLTTLVTAQPASIAGSDPRPIRVTLTGTANPVGQPGQCIWTNTESGTGLAVHLGAITWSSAESVDFCSSAPDADVVGEFTLTAADGDQLFGSYVTLAHPDFAAGVITFSGTWEITGGTGRFANATGEGTLSGNGSLAPPPSPVAATFEGTITY